MLLVLPAQYSSRPQAAHIHRLVVAYAQSRGWVQVPPQQLKRSGPGAWALWQPTRLLPTAAQWLALQPGLPQSIPVIWALPPHKQPREKFIYAALPCYTTAAGTTPPWFQPLWPVAQESADVPSPFFAAWAGPGKAQAMDLLKQYSQFVRWQKSEMPMRILVPSARVQTALKAELQHYKYRQQIVLVAQPQDLLAGAYAYLHMQEAAQGQALLNTAIAAQIPVASSLANEGLWPGLYCAATAADAMKHLYRSELTIAAQARALLAQSELHTFADQLQQFGSIVQSL